MGRKYKIGFAQPTYAVGPDRHIRLAPGETNSWLVVDRFSPFTDLVGEIERALKIVESIDLLEVVMIDKLPPIPQLTGKRCNPTALQDFRISVTWGHDLAFRKPGRYLSLSAANSIGLFRTVGET